MRILTWNINGVRTLPQYYPWNTMATFTDILNALEADILCFQEVKSTRTGLSKGVAIPIGYHSFFSFPVRKSGYSGVSTYVRTTITPLKAEEGICGIPQPKPKLTTPERVSTSEGYPQHVLEGFDADIDYDDLDSEGRTLILDLGLFVLINVYCPNDGNGSDERNKYKADFHTVLEARVKGLIEVEKREVMVVGDLNACAAIIDHCEGALMVSKGLAEGLQGEEGFWGKDVRRWMRDWMVQEDGGNGHMIDITRRLWPDRKGMYTCWNTKISARDSNYGTRIDYILITRGLLPWIKGADIQPHIKGSDHCPVFVDLHDEIVDSAGATIKLLDIMRSTGSPTNEPPRIATKFWDEYSGKQKLLQQFFGKSTAASTASSSKTVIVDDTDSQPAVAQAVEPTMPAKPVATPASSLVSPRSPSSSAPPDTPTSLSEKSSTATKRKLTADTLSRNPSKKKQKQGNDKKTNQASISSFFSKPQATSSKAPKTKKSSKSPNLVDAQTEIIEVEDEDEVDDIDIEDSDHRLALLLSEADAEAEPTSSQRSSNETDATKQAWSTLMAPIKPPKCSVHGEPAKELTVTKTGPNKGKKFFICSRPVGPGYDKGRTERLREHVDHQWRCDYFKWSTDARRQMREGPA